MKAVLLARHGPPEALELTEVEAPSPGPGEVAVRVEAVGVNYAEILSRRGQYGWAPELPYVPGMEAAGRIEGLGEGVDGRRVGEPVIVGAQYGAYAERMVVPAAQALTPPAGYTLEERAAFAVNYLTAWVGLVEMARLRSDDRVSVSPGGGGVGTAAVQIAAGHGCDVVALAGSDEKLTRVKALGARGTVNYRRPDFPERLREEVPDGVDVALEMVGGEVFRACRDALAPFGRVVVAGYASASLRWWSPLSWWRTWRDAPRMSLRTMYRTSTGLLSTHLGYLLPASDRLASVWKDLSAFVEKHDVRPVVGATLPFREVAEAHRLMESRESYGKIVLRL